MRKVCQVITCFLSILIDQEDQIGLFGGEEELVVGDVVKGYRC